jgi:hypothetical protein
MHKLGLIGSFFTNISSETEYRATKIAQNIVRTIPATEPPS